ncbi:MAG: nucleoside 2-deoxyribosyltransferase domain-containing protein [Nitrososphaera sp.]|nr:nucleoside 2-deoxyribosyltransferase domain-containing protein [Nitrososphaera sp.]
MVNKTVYLAGPISGLTYGAATDWRQAVTAHLSEAGIKCLSPLRAEVHLRNHEGLLNDCQTVEENLKAGCQVLAMSTPRGVVARDRFDCTRCSVIFLNLLGAKKVSIGSMIEVGWANANDIPIVLIMEDEGNCHEHAFVRESCAFRTPHVSEGVQIVKAILGSY